MEESIDRLRHRLTHFSRGPGQRLLHDERLLLHARRHGGGDRHGEHVLFIRSHTDQQIISSASESQFSQNWSQFSPNLVTIHP